jgi:hypothetical protein
VVIYHIYSYRNSLSEKTVYKIVLPVVPGYAGVEVSKKNMTTIDYYRKKMAYRKVFEMQKQRSVEVVRRTNE